LTHFSQRYQKIPVLERGNGDGVVGEVAIAEPEAVVEEEEAEAEMMVPMEDDIAPSLPDQTAGEGQKYDLPAKVSKRGRAHSTASTGPPAAVKFKLKSDMKVCVAFDYMRVKVKDMWQMEKFTPALLELFAEEDKSEKASEGGSSPQQKAKANKQKQKQQQKERQQPKQQQKERQQPKQKKEKKKGGPGDAAKSEVEEAEREVTVGSKSSTVS